MSGFDVIVLGGGAAGLMAAITAGQRGKRVLLIEVSNKLGKKILMSGGGRCNFTNLQVDAGNFICDNPHFVKSALSQYSNWDFISLVAEHGVAYHEKAQGQLFCDNSAKDILKLLVDECNDQAVEIRLNCEVNEVEADNGYRLSTNQGVFDTQSVIVATGGLSIPSLGGATGLGYRLAEQFGLTVHPTSASLVPMTLSGKWRDFSAALSGVALPVLATVPSRGFSGSLLLTHRGLSGPVILQVSNYWQLGDELTIDLLPDQNLQSLFEKTKSATPNATLITVLNRYLPNSLVSALQTQWWPGRADTPIHEFKNDQLVEIANQLHGWVLKPSGTEGYRTAEVTRGGIDVTHISSKTMAVVNQPNLFFIGEVLDVTGHLGGFNFQWAWSSGYVAGMNA